MSEATCKTCPYLSEHGDGGDKGNCRRHPPRIFVFTESADYKGIPCEEHVRRTMWPEVGADEWCGEHPERAHGTVVTALQEADADPYVDALRDIAGNLGIIAQAVHGANVSESLATLEAILHNATVAWRQS